MAFDIAGLGGTFAAGFLEGAQGTQKQRELLASQREKEYLETYSNLIKSGEWEPVDVKKGVPDGGVLRVGNIGMLRQRPAQKDMLKELQIANYASLIKSREPKIGDVRQVPTTMAIGEGDKAQIGHGVKVERWNGEQWVETETVPKGVVERAPVGYTTYIDKETQQVVHVPKGEEPPPNAVPASTFVSGENLSVRKAQTRADEYEFKAVEAAKEKRANAQAAAIPNTQNEGFLANKQAAYVQASVDTARYAAMAQAVKDGKSEREVFSIGLQAAEEARAKAESEISRGKPPETSKGVFDTIAEKYKWASEEVQKELARRAAAYREAKAAQSGGPKFIGKIPPRPEGQVVRQPMPERPKAKKQKFKK